MYSDIPTWKTKEVICPYCGKKRTYKYREGYESVDYSSARSHYVPSESDDKGCDCILGRMAHSTSAEKIKIKKQCANCFFNKKGCCTNEQERNDISEMFGISGELIIKDKSKCCSHYQLSNEILHELIELF